MPVSRNNPHRRPLGQRSDAYWRTGRKLDQKRSRTRAKLKAKIGQRCADACRLTPGTVFVNGKFQKPYRYVRIVHQIGIGLSQEVLCRVVPTKDGGFNYVPVGPNQRSLSARLI